MLSALKGCFLSHGGAHCWSFSHQPLWPRQRKRGLMITLKKEKKKKECTGTAEQVWRKGDGGLWVIARDGTDLQFVWLCFAVVEEEI